MRGSSTSRSRLTDALAHAAGQVLRIALGEVFQRQQVEQAGHAFADTGPRHALDLEPEAGDRVQQRRLAAAGRAEQAHELAVRDFQADVLQRQPGADREADHHSIQAVVLR